MAPHGRPEPRRWFDDAELSGSAAYHRPLRRANVASLGADLALGAAVVVVSPSWPGSGATAAAVAAGTLVAVRTPHRLALAWWRERVHEPRAGGYGDAGRSGARPPAPSVAATLAALTLARLAGGVALGVGVVTLAGLTAWWAAVAAVGALAGVVGSSAVTSRVAGPLLDRARPIEDPQLRRSITTLADRAGMGPVPVLAGSGRLRVSGEAAYVAGFGRRRSIVVDATVVSTAGRDPSALEAVVAHELGHWRLGHLRSSLAWASAGLMMMALVAASLGRPQAADLPLLDLVVRVAVLAAAPLAAGLSRRQEAAADRFAAGIVADPLAAARSVRRLLLDAGVELDPPPVARVLASYPPPAERLALLAGAGTAGNGSAGQGRIGVAPFRR